MISDIYRIGELIKLWQFCSWSDLRATSQAGEEENSEPQSSPAILLSHLLIHPGRTHYTFISSVRQ